MSDLTAFRDHCRAMAKADHKPECEGQFPTPAHWSTEGPEHDTPAQPATCDGCVSEADRALFQQLADEVDSYAGA